MTNIEFIKVLFIFLFILGSVRINWRIIHVKVFAYLLGAFFTFIFLHWISLDFPSHRFKSIFRNPNYLAILLLLMLYFKVLAIKFGNKISRIIFSPLILLNIILIYNTNSRAVLITIGIILLTWLVLKKFPTFSTYLFPTTIIFNLLFLFTYINLPESKIGLFLNEKSIDIFGKNFFSGRQVLWKDMLVQINDKLFFGFGVGTRAGDITEYRLSSHNQYLQLLTEVGLVGLIAFIVLLWSIWILLIKKNNFTSNLSASFLIGILVYESFELSLFQNNYSIGLLMWLIMTIGINFKDK
ncbi:O-antigen ligase family protein [Sporosarcina sp. G11-34]|uniref:O-antigen ligase family protein n=1 Tax=Sporosarcina sp. G11-34 TaxID=2849605 RepID=UPI0022A8D868|nr:O-antigen ligase family protein [Sporosarcina sp. G11-34]